MVEFRPVTKENYVECLELQVADSQSTYVGSNMKSLAQAFVFQDTAFPFAVYAGDLMVGFVLLSFRDATRGDVWRLMIDKQYQRKGHGRAALLASIGYLKENYRPSGIFLTFDPANSNAEKLYESVGFKRCGDAEGGEIEMRLEKM
jgi:diamine N-acetyltransferase